MKKESIATMLTFVILFAAIGAGVHFIANLVGEPGASEEQKNGALSAAWLENAQTFTHPDYGFTLKYPEGFTFGQFEEGEGNVVLFQEETNLGVQLPSGGFQIFVSLYEEENPLSKAIIEASAPELKIQNEKNLELKMGAPEGVESERGSEKVGPLTGQGPTLDKIEALSFDTDTTHEVWFVVGGNLYEFTSDKSFARQMEEIIKTIRFN